MKAQSCKDFAQHKSAWNQQEVKASWLLTSSKVISLIYDPQLKSKHLHTFINLETFPILWIAQTKEWEKISCSIANSWTLALNIWLYFNFFYQNLDLRGKLMMYCFWLGFIWLCNIHQFHLAFIFEIKLHFPSEKHCSNIWFIHFGFQSNLKLFSS